MIDNSSSDDETYDIEPDDEKSKFLWACEKGKLDILTEIFKRSPSVLSHRDGDGYSGLHRASYEGNVEVIKFLIVKGADIHAKTNDGWTPLHSACRWNEIRAAVVLLDNGADVNAKSNGLQTPLHLAASCKESRDIIVMLLSREDILPNLKNLMGETAYEIARRTDKYSYLFDSVSSCVSEYC